VSTPPVLPDAGLHVSTTPVLPDARLHVNTTAILPDAGLHATWKAMVKASPNAEVGQVLLHDIAQRDLTTFQTHLEGVSAMLMQDPQAFDPNLAVAPASLIRPPAPSQEIEGARMGNTSSASRRFYDRDGTLLILIVESGWLEGLMELVTWDGSRKDQGVRLLIDGVGAPNQTVLSCRTTPLLLAVQSGYLDVVDFLLKHGASTAFCNPDHLTPLEIAVSDGLTSMSEALLSLGQELSGGLAALRVQLAEEAQQLPLRTETWFGSTQSDLALRRMQTLLPFAFWPWDQAREVVGEQPATWVLMYKCRVMCAFANGRSATSSTSTKTLQAILGDNDFNSFAEDFALSCVLISVMLSIFGLCTLIVLRLRTYGWLEVPVSLSEYIHGAFDPARLADTDFDPSRQRTKLPYRTAKRHIRWQRPQLSPLLMAFMRASMGVFCSWSFQFVRIPPAMDPFDEDYLSEDDEEARDNWRQHYMDRARVVRDWEVLLRNVVVWVVFWWLAWRSKRWHEITLLIWIHILYSFLVSTVAGNVAPYVSPESDSGLPCEVDAALVTHALFSVQHGPRWGRTIATVRSTATANPRNRLRRRVKRKPMTTSSSDVATDDASTTGSLDCETFLAAASPPQSSEASTFLDTSMTCHSDRFQRAFIQAGMLHTRHRSLLGYSMVSLVVTILAMLWLTNVRWLAFGYFRSFYEGMTPVQMFQAYGAPGTARRWVAVLMEVLVLWCAVEWLYAIATTVLVGTIVVHQRNSALEFARGRYPPVLDGHDAGGVVLQRKLALNRIEECWRCLEFALELSAIRWMFLRESIMATYLCTIMFLVMSMFGFAIECACSLDMADLGLATDPVVPFCLGLCLLGPLASVLMEAAAANREVSNQHEVLHTAMKVQLEGGDSKDIEVALNRAKKALESLQASMLSWPGGRHISAAEPALIVGIAVVATLLALFTCF